MDVENSLELPPKLQHRITIRCSDFTLRNKTLSPKKRKKKQQLLKQALEKPRDYVFIVALFKTAKGGNNPIFKGQKKG